MLPCETCGHHDEDAMNIDQERSTYSESSRPTTTHPFSVAPSGYHSSFQKFWDQAKIALDGAFPSSTQPRNSRVGVLLLSFEDDDLGVSQEIKTLKEVLESEYRYEAETWRIPTTKSEAALVERIFEFRKKFCQASREANNPLPLLMVYYGGHSAKSVGDNACRWSSHAQGPCVRLNWTTVQGILFNALADVLVILDCCYVPRAAWRAGANNVGAKETLAASGSGGPASTVGVESFTSALISELRLQARERPVLTAVGLHGRLLQAGHRLKFQPAYAPAHVTRIHVETALGSNSTVVLVSLPVAAWHLLPDHGGSRFVAMVTGQNLLAGGDGVTLATALDPSATGGDGVTLATALNASATGDDDGVEASSSSPGPPSSVTSDRGFECVKASSSSPERPSSVTSDGGFESHGEDAPAPPYARTDPIIEYNCKHSVRIMRRQWSKDLSRKKMKLKKKTGLRKKT